MIDDLHGIQRQWETYKKLIIYVLSGISGKKYIPGDDDLFASGVIDYTEAAEKAYIKTHNNIKAFKEMQEICPEILIDNNFSQGSVARYYVKFDSSLFESILKGIEKFIIEYCSLVFKEDAEEACWNSEEFFLKGVSNRIREEQDPLGIDSLFGE
ncbi:MAG: hypothetical protein FWC03_10575 [Treponema sp.]|nr:hypothetical protein [Treponema sp.]